MKYSSPEESIFLTLSCEPHTIFFQVKDNGIGIPSEFHQHLFLPFHRANNVGKVVGSGLGLAVVKKCLEIHNGEIYVDSEVGGGTSFTIKFPQQGTVIGKSKLSSHD